MLFRVFFILSFALFLSSCDQKTNFENGTEAYNNQDYLKADEYFKGVKNDELEYAQAQNMIVMIKPLVDSIIAVQDSIRRIELEREKDKNIQIEFETARFNFYQSYQNGENEIKQSNVFNESRTHTCNFEKKYGNSFKNWTGIVKTISTDQGGDYVLLNIISKEQGITIEYYESINRDDFLYNYIATLVEGDKVYFDLEFSKDNLSTNNKECFDETSFTELGSLEEPEFVVDFKKLTKIEN